jgi:hypothetical protein
MAIRLQLVNGLARRCRQRVMGRRLQRVKCRVFGALDGHGIHSRGCTTDAVFGLLDQTKAKTLTRAASGLLGINMQT